MENYIVLLPPSEGKMSLGNSEPLSLSFPFLDSKRVLLQNSLTNFLAAATPTQIEKTLELKNKKLDHAIKSNQNLSNSPTLPAIKRYSGTMFASFNYSNLSKIQKENFNNTAIFVDGMFGLLRPQDKIPDYKLKISSRWQDFNVSKFWKEGLQEEFKKLAQDKPVINLLPKAHSKILDFSKVNNHITITFNKLENGNLKNVGHDSKVLKGELLRYISQKRSITYQFLQEFSSKKGFVFSKKYSTPSHITYIKIPSNSL